MKHKDSNMNKQSLCLLGIWFSGFIVGIEVYKYLYNLGENSLIKIAIFSLCGIACSSYFWKKD